VGRGDLRIGDRRAQMPDRADGRGWDICPPIVCTLFSALISPGLPTPVASTASILLLLGVRCNGRNRVDGGRRGGGVVCPG